MKHSDEHHEKVSSLWAPERQKYILTAMIEKLLTILVLCLHFFDYLIVFQNLLSFSRDI